MLTTTGIIIMTIYTVTMLYSIVNDTTRKTSQRIGKILLSIGEGILLYTGSIWFVVLSLGAVALSAAAILLVPVIKEALSLELENIASEGGVAWTVNKAVALTAGATSLVVVGVYCLMVTQGIAA
jgi:hypothetical protein